MISPTLPPDGIVRGTGRIADTPTFAASSEPVSRMGMHGVYGAAPLPRVFLDLKKFTRIKDQFDTSACTGFSLTSSAEDRLRALGYEVPEYSPLWNYSGGRMLASAGRRNKVKLIDEGAYPFLVMMFAQRRGMLAESEMPFSRDKNIVNAEPNLDDFQKGSQFRLAHCKRIDLPHLRVEYMKRAIYQAHIIWGGLQVGDAFQAYRVGSKPIGIETGEVSGHMVRFCGWDDNLRAFLMPNSWGVDWGDHGYAYISYDKIESEEQCADLYDIEITDRAMSNVQASTWLQKYNAILAENALGGGESW